MEGIANINMIRDFSGVANVGESSSTVMTFEAAWDAPREAKLRDMFSALDGVSFKAFCVWCLP